MMGITGDTHHSSTPFAPISHTAIGSSNGNTVTTSQINTTGANFIVIGLSWYNPGAAATLSDSNGTTSPLNTWTGLTSVIDPSGNSARLFYCYGPTTAASQTFTVGGGTNFPNIMVSAFSGALTSPFDQENSHGSNAGGLTSSQDGAAITPVQNNELVITMLNAGGGSGYTVNGGFNLLDNVTYVSGRDYGGAMAWLKQTTAAPVQPTWSWTGAAGNAETALATFKFS
jgi:hypothetical protein